MPLATTGLGVALTVVAAATAVAGGLPVWMPVAIAVLGGGATLAMRRRAASAPTPLPVPAPPSSAYDQEIAEQTLILERTHVGILHVVNRRVRWVNRTLCDWVGRAPEDLVGCGVDSLYVNAAEYERVRRNAVREFRHGRDCFGETGIRGAGGQELRVKYRGRPADPDDVSLGSIWVLENVPRYHKAVQAINLSESVFENADEGIVLCDPERRIVTINRSYCKMTGYRPADAVGNHMDDLGSTRDGDAFRRRMWKSVHGTGRWEGECWGQRKTGELFPAWCTVLAVRDHRQRLAHYLIMMRDITRRKEDEEQIRFQAFYDTLTGLPNRLLFQNRLRDSLATALRNESSLALMYLDLDRFKVINDSLGHETGDALLVIMSKRILACFPETATLARQGGDEFLAMAPDLQLEEALVIAERVREAVAKPLSLPGSDHEVVVTASVGLAMFPRDGAAVADLIRSADTAASHAKALNRNCIQVFTDEMNALAQERLKLENRLRRAIQDEDFVLYYQPKVDLRSGHISGAEALLRWPGTGGLVTPDRFIPVAEETGMIVGLGAWVLRTACRQMRKWAQDGLLRFDVAVNLSPRQLREGDFVATVRAVIEETEIDPRHLELEITEQVILEQMEQVIQIFNDLREMGIRITVDDFGTGYSSLSYLRHLPLDGLKIDRSFIADIDDTDNESFLAGAVVAIGQSLGLKVIAEGVETERQLAFMRQNWCDEIQGYFFSRPLPAEEFEKLIREDRRL